MTIRTPAHRRPERPSRLTRGGASLFLLAMVPFIGACGVRDTQAPEAADAATGAVSSNPETRSAASDREPPRDAARTTTTNTTERIVRSDEEWRRLLTPEQYRILRQAGTERAFTGAYWNTKEAGLYSCAGCGQALFVSDTKFDSGCGWPAFFEKIEGANIVEKPDHSHGMVRTEVVCGRCDGHLGHIFPDGPPPTGMRYCINSAAMTFEPAEVK